MFGYSRKVSFLDLYVNGIKCGNIGVLRQKLTENGLHLNMELCGTRRWAGNTCPVYITGKDGKKNLAELILKEGGTKKEWKVSLGELQSYTYHKLFLHPAENCYAVADLLAIPASEVKSLGTEEFKDDRNPEGEAEIKNLQETEDMNEALTENKTEVAKLHETLSESETEVVELHQEQECDKWELIKKKYPILYPFKGQGPYVSIKPVDLQLLKSIYQDLGNNTFLMHAFYRYRHMILGEYSMDEGTYFYVGVPGEFIKQEQTMAAMCGFEGYEHSGDLGYYLYRVEI